MLERIELEDFQKHKKLALDFEQITTLIGPSDAGKTAILRALDWVCLNNGKSTTLLRRGAKNTSVTINIDGHRITRTTNKNAYWLDGNEFSTIGITIPKEVVNLLRVNDDNFQRQHDYLFWFRAKGSELMSNLNRIVDLSRLEGWVKIGADKEKTIKSRCTYLHTRLNELDRDIASLSVYREMDADLKQIEDLKKDIDNRRAEKEDIQKYTWQLIEYETNIRNLTNCITELDELLTLYTDLKQIKSRGDKICRLNKDLIVCECRIGKLKSVAEMEIDFQSLFDGYNKIQSLTNELTAYYRACQTEKLIAFIKDAEELMALDHTIYEETNKKNDLEAQIKVHEQKLPDNLDELCIELGNLYRLEQKSKDIEAVLGRIAGLDRDIEQKQDEYTRLKEELNEKTGGLCPVCGSSMDSCGDFE